MQLRRLRSSTAFVFAAAMAIILAACGTSSTSSTTGSNTVPNVTVAQFTSDINATMSQFKSLTGYATKGANSLQVGVILPDTTSSTRYVDFDAPYLNAAFADAGF